MRPWQLMRQTTPGVGVIVRTEERQQRYEVGVVVRRWCCSAHRKRGEFLCGWCGGIVVMELCPVC